MSVEHRTFDANVPMEPVSSSVAPTTDTVSAPAPTPFHVAILHSTQYLARNHPALGLTLGYLFLTAVGMTYELLFFDRFDLQIFNFAEPSDFLLVAFREPLLLVFTLVSVFVLVRIIRKRARRKYQLLVHRVLAPWLEKQPWWGIVQKICYVAIFIGYFTTLTSMYANHTAKAIHAGQGTKIQVELIAEPTAKVGDRTGKIYTLLGTTSRYLLLFDSATSKAEVLPINNIARLTTVK